MNRFERYDDPRRRQLIQALAAGAFSLGLPGAGALAAEVLGSRPAKLPPNQSIYRMSGAVTVNGAPATMQTRVASKDTIETGRNGEVVFVVGETAFILRSDSRMTLDADEKSRIVSGLTLFTGKLLSVFPPAKSPPQAQKQMRTRTATVGVRGTGVYIESDPEQTYFCTCYGIAEVTSNTDAESRETIAARQHDKPALHRRQSASRAGDSKRTLHQSHRSGVDDGRDAGRPHHALRLPQGKLQGATP